MAKVEKRNCNLTISLTETEKQILEMQAALLHRSVTQHIVEMMYEKDVPLRCAISVTNRKNREKYEK